MKLQIEKEIVISEFFSLSFEWPSSILTEL